MPPPACVVLRAGRNGHRGKRAPAHPTTPRSRAVRPDSRRSPDDTSGAHETTSDIRRRTESAATLLAHAHRDRLRSRLAAQDPSAERSDAHRCPHHEGFDDPRVHAEKIVGERSCSPTAFIEPTISVRNRNPSRSRYPTSAPESTQWVLHPPTRRPTAVGPHPGDPRGRWPVRSPRPWVGELRNWIRTCDSGIHTAASATV